MLEYSLRSLAKLCFDQRVVPTKEADIQRVMHNHLSAVFPDYSKTVTIPKGLVSFKPDGGVPSLRAAIEYKFVASRKDVAEAVHGLHEDVTGYARSRDWRYLYSVVYLTRPFATEGQFERALGSAGRDRWTTILVTGIGKKAVAAGSWGFLGCPASESGRLCREGGGSRTGRPLSKGAKVGFAPESQPGESHVEFAGVVRLAEGTNHPSLCRCHDVGRRAGSE
jgi:DpnII restriction endonuclease